jgi:sortase A
VDQIRIVLPHETGDLRIEPGQDLCTLVTCTPYGVNTHRLLVRGHRIETKPGLLAVTAEAIQIKPAIVMPAVAVPILLVLVIWVMVRSKRKSPRAIMDSHRRDWNENS